MVVLSLISSSNSSEESSEKKPPEASEDASASSIISKGAKIEGILDFTSVDLCIEGIVHGDISTDGRVVVSEGAEVQGTISAHTVRLAGHVEGHVQAEDTLVLCPSADVKAILGADVLEIQPGASFVGEVTEEVSIEPEMSEPTTDSDPSELMPGSTSPPNGPSTANDWTNPTSD